MYDKIEYIKNTLAIEGYDISEEEIDFLKEAEKNKYSKEQIIQKVLEINDNMLD
jgi:hypothetical protein